MSSSDPSILNPSYWTRKCEEISESIAVETPNVKVMMSYDWVDEYEIKTKNNHFYKENFKELYKRFITEGMGRELNKKGRDDSDIPSLKILERTQIGYTSRDVKFFNGAVAFILLIQSTDAEQRSKDGEMVQLSEGCPL